MNIELQRRTITHGAFIGLAISSRFLLNFQEGVWAEILSFVLLFSMYSALIMWIREYQKTLPENKISLKPALTWNTKIIQVKEVPAHSKIGYGGTYTTSKPAKIAILPVEYWDGYDRKLSNQGEVEIKGIKCKIRGKICMNLMMVDVGRIENVKAGDKATLIGTKITADDLAKQIGTINYEVVDRINPQIPRIIVA